MSVPLKQYIIGGSAYLEAQFTDINSTPNNPIFLDADSNEITITDDDGKVAVIITDADGIVHDGLGLYHVDFTIPTKNGNQDLEPGIWKARWIATRGGKTNPGDTFFKVVP